MRIFETRHGQVLPKNYYQGDASKPVGNTVLSALGDEQAKLVGKRLKEIGFRGVIFASPYERTLRTANFIAEQLNATFIPLPCLREISSVKTPTDYKATGADIQARYFHAQTDKEKTYVWRDEKAEDLSDVIERLKEGLQPVLSGLPKDIDVLLVGHAAVSVALRHIFRCETDNRGFHWNCHLSLLYATDEKTYANDSEHLPETMRTGNSIIYMESKKAWAENVAEIRAFLQANEGEKVLHIGDTQSANYGYFKRLIEEVQPDVIVHTGDLVDELKAGRIESVRTYWETTVPVILKTMKDSGARVVIVPGNNDLENKLVELADGAEVVARNTVLKLYGKKFCVCHELNRMDESVDAEIFLYGHGLTGETRTKEDNERDGKKFFNATWGASLHVPAKGASLILPNLNM